MSISILDGFMVIFLNKKPRSSCWKKEKMEVFLFVSAGQSLKILFLQCGK